MSLNILRSAARKGIAGIFDWYEANAGVEVALSFVEAVEKAAAHIVAHPASGSPNWRHHAGMQNLRTWPIKGFPHLAFYLDGPVGPAFIRVLHAARDIPSSLGV